MKRILALLLLPILVFAVVQTVSATSVEPVSPRYTNTSDVNVSLRISNTGTALISVNCIGSAALVSAQTTTYIERRDGASWVRVNNGQTNNEWVYTTTSQTISKTYSVSVSRTGQYRAVTIFKLAGDTTERITKTSTATFGG